MSVTQTTIAYESIATVTPTNIGDSGLTITKPTGLAEGDLMLAGMAGSSTGMASWAPPSGWTEVFDTASNAFGLAVSYKEADTDDVAASNFTFTPTDGSSTNIAGGFIMRISNYGEVLTPTSATGVTITQLAPGTITPDYANSMFVLIAGEGNNNPDTNSLSSYSMATDDPSWTERADLTATGAGWGTTIAVATAVRSEATASGAFNVTYASTTDRAYAVALCITPKRNGAITPSDLPIYSFVPPLIKIIEQTFTVETPSVNAENYPEWSNPDKPSDPSWTNPDK